VESIFSPSWYRVSYLKPRLRKHVDINRQIFRGKVWHVVHDRLSGKFHRLGKEAYYIVGAMNGEKSFHQIWEQTLNYLGDDAPTQDEMIQLLAQLHATDILLCDVTPDCAELFERFKRQDKQKWKQILWSPLSQRFPLIDPEKFLEKWKALLNPLFSPMGFILWLSLVVFAAAAGFSHWDDLTKNISDRVLAPDNLFIMLCVYPLVKGLHELGHAFATKTWGGEVHEMGIMLLVFMPVPYVDASSASAFAEKNRRIIVGAAGIMVELFLASIALFFWLNMEPGLGRSIAFNVILIGSVSTVFFNGNPLLRFDGYYIFSDLLEIPNLSSRANNYLGYVVQKYLFGLHKIDSPASTPQEKGWLFFYGIAAFCYRIFIVFSIILFIAGKFFFIGVFLAVWAGITSILFPIWKAVRFVITSPKLSTNRGRAFIASIAGLSAILSLLFLVPVPLTTRAEGVVWLPEEAFVRASTSGFVEDVLVQPFSDVNAGQTLIKLSDPFLNAEKEALEYELLGYKAQYKASLYNKLDEAQILKEEMATVKAKLDRTKERAEQLIVSSSKAGLFILPRAEDLISRWMVQGSLLGYVVSFPINTVRVVVTQDSLGLIREKTKRVDVRFVEIQDQTFSARISHQAPAAKNQLPSIALGKAGGGEIAIDPMDENGDKTFDTVFEFDLLLDSSPPIRNIGERVYIRFDHGFEPLIFQWYRKIRLLFLRKFNL